MPNITATRYARAVGTLSQVFSTARESDSTSHFDSSTSSNIEVYQFFRDTGKGATNWRMYRFFAVFDFSSYSGQTISNLVFNYRSTTSTNCGTCRIMVLQFDGMGSGPGFSAYDDSEFFEDIDYSTTYTGTGGSAATWTDANSDATITLNATAQTAASSGELKLAIVQYDNDYSDDSGLLDGYQRGYMNFSVMSSGFTPYMSFDAVASGYGNNVIGVDSSNIAQINDVATADISTVCGV